MSDSFSRVQIRKLVGNTIDYGITAGVAAANKAVVLDSSKGIATITSATITTITNTTLNNTTTNSTTVNAGADAAAGTVNSFPSSTASGKLILAAVNSSGAFNTTISNASQGQSTVISIPDPGSSTANFVLDKGTATIGGAKTFSSAVTISPTTNQIVLGAASHLTTISSTAPAGAARVYTIPDLAADGNIVLSTAAGINIVGATGNVTLSPLKWVDVAVASTDLGTAGTKNVIAGASGDQYKIRNIRLVGGGTNYSAGGDRAIGLTDGTTTWTTIANGDIETAPTTTLDWGNAKVPFLTGTSNTASASGQAIRFAYNGGTTDHTTGSITFSVCIEKTV